MRVLLSLDGSVPEERDVRGMRAKQEEGFASANSSSSDALVQGGVAGWVTSVVRKVVNQWKAQGSIERRGVATRWGATDCLVEQSLEAENRRKAAAAATRLGALAGQQREGRGAGDIATATRAGKASEGVAPSGKARCVNTGLETRRTPWPAVRCNRLARCIAE
jgi:hypothetical protein